MFLLPAQWLSAAQDLRPAGLFDSPEFTTASNEWIKVSESGWICGHARPKANSSDQAAWVTSPMDGVTRRIGLTGSPEFTVEGYRSSTVVKLTESGWVQGYSNSPIKNGDWNEVPWLANGATGITHRAGLTGQEFTFSPSGRQISTLKQLTESGYAWGISSRYRGANRIGQAVWMMDGRKGTVFRVGLFTGAETADDAESDGFRLTDSGWLAGRSGDAVWVADAATGTTRRMGFDRFAGITESGWMAGTSGTYSGGGSDDAAWVASAANGVARRIGLYEGPHYTSNLSGGRRNSFIRFMTESGWISGQSDLFGNSGSYSGTAAWVADAATGATRRVGLFGDA
ncbi:MAG: hypothetical protein EOP86_24695, partial [Verrucomicrobiaceae bacterium]